MRKTVIVAAMLAWSGLALAQQSPRADADARPVRPPMPDYPREAARAGLSGYCDVLFNVDVQGRVSHVRPTCSHPAFCASATVAMEATRFMPARKNGRLVPRSNVVYPLEYQIYGAEPTQWDLSKLEDCVDPDIS